MMKREKCSNWEKWGEREKSGGEEREEKMIKK